MSNQAIKMLKRLKVIYWESSSKKGTEKHTQGHFYNLTAQKGLDKQSQNHFTVMQAAKGNRNMLPGLQGENL